MSFSGHEAGLRRFYGGLVHFLQSSSERTAIDVAPAREAFERCGVVPMKADWTNATEITAALKKFGRVGVPFYAAPLIRARDGQSADHLPEIPTASVVASFSTIGPRRGGNRERSPKRQRTSVPCADHPCVNIFPTMKTYLQSSALRLLLRFRQARNLASRRRIFH